MEWLVIGTLRLAIKGNAAALKEVWERLDGKVRQDAGLQVGGLENLEARLRRDG